MRVYRILRTLSIAPVLIARFILDLRMVAYPNHANTSATLTTVRFAPGQFTDDLAGSIGSESTWVTGQGEGSGHVYGKSKEHSSVALIPDIGEDLQLEDLGYVRF